MIIIRTNKTDNTVFIISEVDDSLREQKAQQKYNSQFKVYHLFPVLFIPMSKAKYLQTITLRKFNSVDHQQ